MFISSKLLVLRQISWCVLAQHVQAVRLRIRSSLVFLSGNIHYYFIISIHNASVSQLSWF